MGGIKSRITINIFFVERIKSHLILFLLKCNKNKGRKKKRGKKQKRRKKNERRKKKRKKKR